MLPTRLVGRVRACSSTVQPYRWLIPILLLLTLVSGSAFAEGSRTLHPSTYSAAGARGVMDVSASSNFAGVAPSRQFLYVYAQAGEYILLGSRNVGTGSGQGRGDIYVYNPQSFGAKGDETIPGTRNFTCSTQTNRGTIASRAQELAGPNSADGTATVTNGYAPCWYIAPSTGIYGVLFTGASQNTVSNNASVATPGIFSQQVSAWDVTVRNGPKSLADINGRLFTYNWTVYTSSNGANYRLYNDLYYVSTDGYRYRQSFRGIDPNRAAFYANAAGFLDSNGAPLYRDLRGSNAAVTSGPSFSAGITAQPPQYPIFFSDAAPAGVNATEVGRVLTALAIPLTPTPPQLLASPSPNFVGNMGGNNSTVSSGGTFTFSTSNTLTYEIVISRDGVNFDPANVLNRVLTGTALTGAHTVLWDGRDNNGNPFPVGTYTYRIVGRNGEIHFPMIDVEASFQGGPTLTKLNGSQDTTVYYDDRGYKAANGTLIGTLNDHLCGTGSLITQPVPSYSLTGVDSADANFNNTGKYYRWWDGSQDSNSDCQNRATEFFGTAKGMDLWALEKSQVFEPEVVIVPPTVGVDVGTMVNVTPQVLSGETAYGSFTFTNAGDVTATGVTYSMTLGNPTQPNTCPASVNFPLRPAGVTATYNPAPACTVTFTGMPTTLTSGQSLNFNFNYVVAPTNPGPIPVATHIAAANENNDVAPNDASAQTIVAKPIIAVVKSSTPAPNTLVNVGDTITYTLSVNISNAPLTSVLTLTDTLGTGLTFGSISSSHASFTCSGSLTCALPSGTAIGSYTVTYTATVNGSASVRVRNNVVPTGGGGQNPPACGPCSVDHPIPTPAVSVVKTSNPASGASVVAGQTITYTLTATVTDAALTQPLVLTDTLSANQTFGSVTALGAYTCTGSVQCTLPIGTAPGTYAVSYTATVNNNASGQVGNNVAATGGGPTPPTCTTCSTTHPMADPLVSVVKTSNPASGASVTAGQTITYTLTATVADAALTQPLVLTDTLSANQTFGSVTALGAYTCTGSVQCTLPVGTAPGTYAVSYTATVNNNASGQVGNNVAATGGGPTPPTCTTCSTTHPMADPLVSVVKTSNPASGASVTAGQTITYTLTATVADAALTQPLVLTDTLSANQTFGSVTALGAYTCTGSVQCTLPVGTAPGTYAVSYTATVNNNASGTVGNNVAATGGGGNPPTCTTCSTTHPLTNPVVSVVKTSNPASGASVIAGQTITYTLTATVTDAALTQPLVLTDTLSANQTFGSVTALGAYTCTGTVQCTLPVGTAPGTYAVSYTAAVNNNASGTVGNNVAATGGGPTPPTCTTCSTTHPMADPLVSVVKTSNPASGASVTAGQTITYTLTATVADAALTQPLVLTDTLSANQTFGSVTALGAYTCTGSVQCTLPIGTAPGTYAVSYTATVNNNASGQVGNNVAATGGGPTPPTCTTCSTTHPLTNPVVSVVKTSNPASGASVIAGQTITYTLTATVTDAALTQPLVLTDTLSANQTFGSVTALGAYTCTGSVQCTLPVGTAPGTYAVSYTATVNNNASGTVGNNVAATGGGPTPPTCTTCSTTHPMKDPAIAVVKTSNPASGASVTAGQTITYTLTATVADAALTQPLVLIDTLSANQTFGSVTALGAYTCTGSVQCTLPIGTAPGTYAVSYTATVNNNASGTVGNNVAATGGGPTPPTCTTCSTTHPMKDPAIAVAKTSNPASGASVIAGQTITYTLTATVADAALTQPLVLTDTLSANQTFGSVTALGAYTCTGSVQCTLPIGTAPGTYAVTYTATVNNNASGQVGNNVAATGGGPTPPTCTTCSTTHPMKDPAIAVVKTSNPASGASVTAGQTITYTLTATVTDAALTQPLVLTDTLSANQTFGSVTALGAYTCTGSVQCTLPVGTAPGTYAVSYTATVNNNASGQIGNNVAATGGGPTPPTCTTCSTTHPMKDPAIAVVKTSNPASGASVIAGQTITYTLTATVTDAALTSDLVLTDTLGTGLNFGAVTPGSQYTADTSAAPVLKFTLAAGKVPGTYAVSYTVTVKNDAAGTVKNAVTATGGGSTPPTCTTCSTTHPLADPVVSVVKTSNPTPNTAVAAGETITYTLTATVADAALTSDLVLTDTLGTGLTFGAVTPGSQYTADTSAAPVLKFTLAAGKVPGTYAVSYTVTVKNDATGTVRNNVTATGGSGTPPTCTTCSTTHPLKDPAIHVMKTSSPTDGATVAPGETITFTLTATVADAALTSDLVLADTLGTGLTFGAVVPGSPYTADPSAAPVLKFTLPTGTVPGTYAVSYTATVDAGATGNVVNNVVATGGSPTDPVCNPCSTTHPLEPNVAVTKALTGEDGTRTGVAEPGETLTYTITLHNSGGVAATGVAITDKLDANTTFVSADNGGSHAAGVVTWNGLTVSAGGTRLLTVQAKVVDPIPQGVTQVANLAYLTGSTPPACPPSGPQCVVTPTAANLSVTKALSGESLLADGVAQPGEQLTYTITVRNFGGTATTGTIVNETVPLHTTFVGPAGTWTCTAGAPAGTACNTLVNVPPHDGTQPGVVTLTFTVKVDDPLPAGVTSVANAVALNDGTPPDCAANPGNAACVVTPTVNLGFTKTVASVTTTGPGAFRVNYAIAVVNTGGAATTYTLTDTLGFASGVVFTGNAQVSTVGGTLNPAIAGGYAPVNGTVVQLSASNVSVASGATHTYTVSVPVGVPSGIADAACVPGTPGHGFYNAAGLTGTFALETSDCAPIGTDVPLIHLVKTVTLATDVNGNHYGDVGDVLGYQFTISNPGTVPLTTVQLFDPRVQNLSCPAFTVNGAPFKVLFGDELFDSGFEPRAGGGTLLPGDSVVCTASYTLTAADVALRRVVNSATAIGSGPAGQTVSSVATAIFTQFR